MLSNIIPLPQSSIPDASKTTTAIPGTSPASSFKGYHIVIVFGISHSAFQALQSPNPFITELIKASTLITNSTLVYEVDEDLSNENETFIRVYFKFMSGDRDNEGVVNMYYFLKDVLSSETDSQILLPLSSQYVSFSSKVYLSLSLEFFFLLVHYAYCFSDTFSSYSYSIIASY